MGIVMGAQAQAPTTVSEPTDTDAPSRSQPRTLALLGLMFFTLGFVTWLNGPLISFVKLAFTLSDAQALLVPLVFYISYLFLALPSAAILSWSGMKRGMALGLGVMAIGALIFGESVSIHVFNAALAGLFVIGAGLALMQTAVNPYVIIAGPSESAAQRVAIMGICNKTAGMLAPIVFGALVMQGVGALTQKVAAASPAQRTHLLAEFANKVHTPYRVMALLLGLLACGVLFSPLPSLRADRPAETKQVSRASALRSYRGLWLGALCMFLYMGAEVMAGDAIGIYGAGFYLPIEQTAYFTSFTLAAMLVGYGCGLVAIPRFVSQDRYLAFSAICGVAASIGSVLTHDYVSVACVALLGFANAMMWPAIFPLAIRGLGRHTEIGSAILVMGISGGAIVPQLFAALKQHINFQIAFTALMVPIYIYIIFYALTSRRLSPGPLRSSTTPS